VSHLCYLHVLCPPTNKCSFALQALWSDTTKVFTSGAAADRITDSVAAPAAKRETKVRS
jgi:hypothetical protein